MAKPTLKVQILGRTWQISALDTDSFKKRFEDEYAGITLPITKEVVINLEELNLPTVVHELTHAYLAGLCTGSANLSVDQYEEIYCEFMSIHAVALLTLAKKVYKALKDNS